MPRRCSGFEGQKCRFSTSDTGAPVQPGPGRQKCIFCDLASLETELNSVAGGTNIIRRLAVPWRHPVHEQCFVQIRAVGSSCCILTQVLWSKDEPIFEAALARVGEMSPNVAEYEGAAKSYDFQAVQLQRRLARRRPAAQFEDDSASEPCTAASGSP